MNLDEQIFKRVDKQMLNQLMNENVKPIHITKNYKKPSFYWAFFLPQHFIRARRKHEKSTKKKSSNESII